MKGLAWEVAHAKSFHLPPVMDRNGPPDTFETQSGDAMAEAVENLPVFVSPILIRPRPSPTLTRVSTVGDRMAAPDPEPQLPAWKQRLRRSKSTEGGRRTPYSLFPGARRGGNGQYETLDLGASSMAQPLVSSRGPNQPDDASTAAAIAAAVAATGSPRMSDATHAFVHTIAGAAGAVVAMAIVYPLDSLRTIQSIHGGNAWEATKLHLRHGGWRRLYRGMRAAFAGVIFSWGTYFFVYTLAKQKEKNR